ncbi:hypothetical protein [Ehrlichia canis]|uniref:hypothetical protein n=1 Tax=Ehrlichia canis TaxID=944 RepID=UPI000C83F34D|nr:hypothetical protein [Ehrlichia canis]AUO54363.1 hypothetical protein C1I72_00330 [Ehrlichia canis]UKC52961.1 hypothetical protein s20019040002_000002 [Ehrlichia canis]UKC53898.1 hypothetical protein s20026770001_000002 [Ehrlichia canis]UKC54834.1 hypothetical protein s21009500007_000002 [Ehrlichia canis]
MYQQQPSIESIKGLLNNVFEEVSEVSIDYVKMWEYIYWACLIRSDDYLDTINLVRQCDKEHDIFHHAVMCNPEVFISEIAKPKFSSVLQSIKDNHEDCKTIELCLLNGYALSVIVADPLFEEFRLKVTSIRIGGINLCQDIYNEVKEKNSRRGVDKCSEEDVDFLVRGVMYESHIKKYLHLFPNLIYLDCVVAEQKCCKVLFKTLKHYTPKLYYLSLKCANAVPAVKWEIGEEFNDIQLKVKELLLVNCSMDLLLYFLEIESLFIIAPQNLPEDRKILLHDYYYNPDSVVQLLVSTNSYMVDSDGKISCVPVDYDIMSFQKLEVLAINPCQDMSSILYMDGLWDTEAGLNFVDQLITSRKYNLLSGLVDSHPSLLRKLFFVTSPIHKIDLLEDNEELFPKLVPCHFKNGASLIKSLGVGYLIPHFSYSKFGASKRDLKLIQLRLKITKALKDFESELFDNEAIYGDIIKYITRLAYDANGIGSDQSASDKFLKNVLSEAHFYDSVSLGYLVKIVSVNFPTVFCGEFFGSLLDYEESLHIYLVKGIETFIRRKFVEGSIKTLADLKDALLVFQKSAHGKANVAGTNEPVSRILDAILAGPIKQNVQNPHVSAKALCISKLDLYAKEILNDVVGIANVLQIDKSRKITSFVESTLCKTIPCIISNITRTIDNTYASLADDFWEDIFASYNDEFIKMLPNNYQFCTALVTCSTIVKNIGNASSYVRTFLLLDEVGIKLVELRYDYMKLRMLKLSRYSNKMFASLAVLTFFRQVLNFSGMSDEKIRDYLSFCGVKDFASMIIVISNLAFNKLRNFNEQKLIADHRDLGFYEDLNQAFIQHKISHEFMLKILSDVLANTITEVMRLYELHLVPLLEKKVNRLIGVIGNPEDMLQMKNVISSYIMSVRDVFIVKNDLYHFVDDEIVDSDVEMFDRIQSFSPISRKGLLDILNVMFCAKNADVDLLIAQQSSCVLMYLQPMMQGVSFSFKSLNSYRFIYRAINTMYIPYENKYKYSFTRLQSISNVPIVLVSLLFQKIFYSYAKDTIDRQLLFKILYKFQHYFDFQFIQYCFILPQVLENDANVFIYVKQSQNLVQVLRQVEPEVIISTIDNVVRSEVDITELYNTVLSSLILLNKSAVPELSSKEKDYFSKMIDLFQNNFETHGILDGDVMRIISIKLTFEDWSIPQSRCVSDCMVANLSNIKVLKSIQECCDLWVVDLRNQILECEGFPNLNVLDIRNDLVNKCKNVDGINDLTYQLILDKLKPSILPVQYLDEIACCIVLDLVQHIVDNEHINVFYERLVDALVSRKKLSTMQNICETVLQTLKGFLLNKDEFLIGVSSHRQTSLEKEEQTSADSLLSQCFAEWCYVILENLFKGKDLANSVKSYSIAQFVSDNGLPESALLDLEKRMKQRQQVDKYLRLIDRFKSICMRNNNVGIQDRVDTRSRQIFNIENSQIIPLMQKKLSMNKDNTDDNISRLLNDDQYDFSTSQGKSTQILKIIAMMFYSLKPCNKQPVSVHQYVCDNVYISLMKISLISVFFDKGIISGFEIISVVRVLLNMFSSNPYFVNMRYLDFSENIMNYVTEIQYGDFEDKTPRKICNLGFHLVWEMLGVLLHDLLLNCLSDVDSSLCYAEDYFKRLNNIDDYTMLLVKFYYRNVLLRYSEQSSVDSTLKFHPVVFLCKFLKVFDYDLLKYYLPECNITLPVINGSKGKVTDVADTHSLKGGSELPELDEKSVSKKQRSRKKSKKKEEKIYANVVGDPELMYCDETAKEFLISRCVNDLSEAVAYITEVKGSDHLVVKEENFAGVTDALSKSQGPSEPEYNITLHVINGSKGKVTDVTDTHSLKGGSELPELDEKSVSKKQRSRKKSKKKEETIYVNVVGDLELMYCDETAKEFLISRCENNLSEAVIYIPEVKDSDYLVVKEENFAGVTDALSKSQGPSDQVENEEVRQDKGSEVQKRSKKSNKKAKKSAVSKDKIGSSVPEKVDILSVDESVSNRDDLEEKTASDVKVADTLPKQEKETSIIVTETLANKEQESSNVLTSEQVLKKAEDKAQKNSKKGNKKAKKGAVSKDKIESSVLEKVDILSVDESVSNRDDLEEKTASDIKVEDTLPKQEKETSIIVTETLANKEQESSNVLTSEQVLKKAEDKAQKNSKKGNKKAKKSAVSKDKIESSVLEKVDILSVDESVGDRDDLEAKTANDIKVEDTLPKQEKETSIIVTETLANREQESSNVLTSEQVFNKKISEVQYDSVAGKKIAESKENELVELVSIVEESINESLNHEDNLEGDVIDGCVTGFKSSEILLIQNENSDGQELPTRSLSRKASKKARKQALKMQEDCQKSKKKTQKNTKHNNARKIVKAETESTSILEDQYSSVSTASKRPISNVVVQSSDIGQDCRQLQVNYIEICDEILHTHRSDLEKLFGSYDEERLRVIIESISVKNLISQKIINLEMKRMKRIATSNTGLNVVMPSLEYTSSLYRIRSKSMCDLRFSHFLYSVQLIDSLFEVVNSNSGSRKVVVKGTAHRVLKNVFGYRKDYNFFVILMKVFVLLNLSAIAISHSDVNLRRINVYFKHSCDVFKMDLNPILLEVIQVLESIKGKEIDLYQLQNCMSGIFCKFFKESMPNDNYSLRFLKSLLSILSIITVDTALANDNDLRIVRDAAMFGCIIYIGSMFQQYTVQYSKLEQDNHPFKQLTCQDRSFWFMQEDYKKVVNLIKLFNTFRNRLVHCYDSENERFAERFKALSSQGRCFNSKYDIADILPTDKHKCYHAWHDTSDFFATLSITVLQTELLLINDSDCDSLGYSFLNRIYAFFQRCNMDIYPYALSERVNVDTDKMLALIRLRTALSTFCSNSASGFETSRHYILSLNQTLEKMQYCCDNRLFSTCIKKYTVMSKLLEQERAISFDADSMTDTSPIHDGVNNFQYDGNSDVLKKHDVRFDDVPEQDTVVDVKLEMSTDTDLVESMRDDSLSVSVDCDTSFIGSTFEQRNYTPTVDLKVPSCSRSFDIEDDSCLANVTRQGNSSTSLEAPSYSGLLDVESSITGNYTSNARLEGVPSYSMQNAQCANNLLRSVVNNSEVADLPVQENLPFSSNLVGDVQYADNLTVSYHSDTDLINLSKRRIRGYKRPKSNIQNTYNPLVCANDSDFMKSAYTHQKNRTTYDARLGMHDYNSSVKIMQPSYNLPSSQLSENPQVRDYATLGARPETHYGSQQKKDVQHTTNLPNIGNNSSSVINNCFTQGYSTFSNISGSDMRYVDNPLVSEKPAVSLDGQRYLTHNARLGMHDYNSSVKIMQPSYNLPSSQLSENPQVRDYATLGARPKTHYGSQQKKDVQHTTNLPNIGNNSSSVINNCFTQGYSTFSNISGSDMRYVDNPLVSEKPAVSLDGQRYLTRNTRLGVPNYDDSVGMMQCSGSLPRCQVGNYPTVITNPNVQQHATSLNTRLSLHVYDCSVESVSHDDLQVDDLMNSIANPCVQGCCYPAGYKYMRN